jgi:hypothetical protein
MGIASATAEIYARHNIPSIPLGEDKRPLVGRFKIASLTMAQSRAFMRRRPEATALGIPDGRLSGIVRLDIDEHGDHIERAVIERAGDTPAKVRTASGKRHLIYAFNGERRLTGIPGRSNARPWPDLKVDLCGDGGFSVSPPSRCKGGEYALLGDFTLEQLLEQRHQLPTIRGLESRAYQREAIHREVDHSRDDLRLVGVGNRDAMMYPEVARICQRVHQAGGTKDHALAEAMSRHAEFPMPHENPEVWVGDKVDYWWAKTIAGDNRFGTGHHPHAVGWEERLASEDPPLHALLTFLRKWNGPDAEFRIANGLIGTHLTGWWSTDRLRDNRQKALDGGWIKMIVPAARNRHAVYRWGPTAFTTIFA